jgi:hypothetical protein
LTPTSLAGLVIARHMIGRRRVASDSRRAIERRIDLVRAYKVMLNCGLADLYGITTGNLNLAVKRNRTRFPAYFMFQLTKVRKRMSGLSTEIAFNSTLRRLIADNLEYVVELSLVGDSSP